MKTLTSYWAGAVMATAICVSSCSGSPRSENIPLEQLTGQNITFNMCGKLVSVPRHRVANVVTAEATGVSLHPIASASFGFLEFKEMNDSRNPHAGGSGVIGCSSRKYKRMYQNDNEKYAERTEFPEWGLEQLHINSPSMPQASIFRPLAMADRANGFFMTCRPPLSGGKDFPVENGNCEINGVFNENIYLEMRTDAGTALRHWRAFKDIFESFVRVEAVQGRKD